MEAYIEKGKVVIAEDGVKLGSIKITDIEYNGVRNFKKKTKLEDQILLGKDVKITKNEVFYIGVYIRKGRIRAYRGTKTGFYKILVTVETKAFITRLNKKGLRISVRSYISNPYSLDITSMSVSMGDKISYPVNLKQTKEPYTFSNFIKHGNINTWFFPMDKISSSEFDVNTNISICIKFSSFRKEVRFNIRKCSKRINNKNLNYYYSPMSHVKYGDTMYHLRRSKGGAIVLVKRQVFPIEETLKFRIIENYFVSMVIYSLARFIRLFRKKKINVFYEKFSQKCDEGGFDLFLKASDGVKSRNYFIMDETAVDYEKIKNVPHVIKKYSLRYYWIVFSCDWFISTDTPSHISVIRSNNYWIRKITYDTPFFMLQHGVTYLKAHKKNSPYIFAGQYPPTYMVAGSEKEKEAIIRMLQLPSDHVLITGLPVFSRIEYNHIGEDSENIITLMLTWKPYDEGMEDYTKTTYYRDVTDIYNMLLKHTDRKNIRIVPHPIMKRQFDAYLTDNMYEGPIAQALSETKLLITDYSSVCYNAFYQGAGVIFFHSDIEYYEKMNGKLVPQDDEYIGYRAFNLTELEEIISNSVHNGDIDLSYLRTNEFKRNALLINQFTDGKNIDRIYDKLVELKIV